MRAPRRRIDMRRCDPPLGVTRKKEGRIDHVIDIRAGRERADRREPEDGGADRSLLGRRLGIGLELNARDGRAEIDALREKAWHFESDVDCGRFFQDEPAHGVGR